VSESSEQAKDEVLRQEAQDEVQQLSAASAIQRLTVSVFEAKLRAVAGWQDSANKS